MSEAEKFYLLSHIFISFIGSVLLWATWYNIRQRFKRLLQEEEQRQRVDKGLAYLSAAVFVWVLSGTWGYFSLIQNWTNLALIHAGQSFLSTVNSFFFLLAMFYLDESPGFIHKNTRNVKGITIGLVLLATLSVAFFNWFETTDVYGIQVRFLPDFLLSVFTSFLLIISFYRVFMRRGFRIIAVISVVTVLVMLYSQLPEVFSSMQDTFANNLMKIIAKTSLISIFLVLATNWVIQLASTPKSSEMKLAFSDWSLVTLTIPSKGIYQVAIDFASKTTQFRNFLKFAVRRKYGNPQQQYIEVGNLGEIVSQTYLTRIIDNINEIGEFDADQRLERKDIFTFVGQGQYRLRIVPDNIEIDPTLLNEFIAAQKETDYQQIQVN